jgi:hypothetical protein
VRGLVSTAPALRKRFGEGSRWKRGNRIRAHACRGFAPRPFLALGINAADALTMADMAGNPKPRNRLLGAQRT